MSNLKQTGVIEKIFDREQKTASFASRVIVLRTGKIEYPQTVPIEFSQDRCDILDNFKEGETVTISFELRGREWQGKYYSSLNGWKIEREGTAPPAPEKQPETAQVPTVAANPEPPKEVASEDLPF